MAIQKIIYYIGQTIIWYRQIFYLNILGVCILLATSYLKTLTKKENILYKTLSAPHIVQIEVSAMCTNRCLHCYNFWRQNDGYMTLTNPSLEKVDRIMDQLIAHRVFNLVLTGGEPLLNKEGMFRILERAIESDMATSVNSTLVTLDKKDATKFKELRVSTVLTSLLGPTAEIHNQIVQRNLAFEETIHCIKILQQAKVPVSVNMVISKKNHHLILETAKLVKSLGLKNFNATRASCPGNCCDFSEFSLSLQEFRLYLENLNTIGKEENMLVDALSSYPLCGIKEVNRYQRLSSRRCMAGVNTITVSAMGDVRPCGHFDVSYGNLLREDLSSIWQRMTEWRDGRMLPVTCQSCKVLPRCGGGCRMEAKMRRGSPSELDPYASPSDADYVYGQLTSRDKKSFTLPSTVRLNPKMRWRPESFGAALFVGARFACYLNSAGLKLIQNLPRDIDLSTTNLIERLEASQENFVEGLIERGVLVSTNP